MRKTSSARMAMNGRFKIFSDPVHGFISIPRGLVLDLVASPEVQRLRRIRQLGIGHMVFPGAEHSRFGHALGAMALMHDALSSLSEKGTDISAEEIHAAQIAALLHDVGHGPFSHTLEHELLTDFNHEQMSRALLARLNRRFGGQLEMALAMFDDTYERCWFNDLISSQLDMDRLDYLRRDSYYTGVVEGRVGVGRIIKTLRVHPGSTPSDDRIVVEAKGSYAVENFLIARRLMYWQVYLHKTVVSAEFLLMNILIRAKEMAASGMELDASTSMRYFLYRKEVCEIKNSEEWLKHFVKLDDYDMLYSIKQWIDCGDPLLSNMCKRLINRRLLKTKNVDEPLSEEALKNLQQKGAEALGFSADDMRYLVFQKSLSNTAYTTKNDSITILYKDGTAKDISEAATIFQFSTLESIETKHFIYFPDEVLFQ